MERNHLAAATTKDLKVCFQNSTVTLPRAAYRTWSSNTQSTPPSVANANAAPYAKLLLSSPEYRQSQILEREQRELRGMIAEADNEAAAAKLMGVDARGGMASERPFVEVALTEVKVRKQCMLMRRVR